jgi:hypothetical protein
MRNLRTYFTVIFDSPKISDDKLRKFAEIHLQRLSADNPGGVFTPLITATTAAYQAYFGAIVDEATRTAIQKGMTLKMNDALDAFLEAVRRQEGRIRADYGKESAEYTEFYPQGLMEYNQSTLANVEALMLRYAKAAEPTGIIAWLVAIAPAIPILFAIRAIFLLPAMAYWLNVGAAEAKARVKRLHRQPRHAHAAGSAGGIGHGGGMLKPEPQSSVNGKL